MPTLVISDKSITYYKRTVVEHPKTEASREALIALREIYVSSGRADEFIAFTESQDGISISASMQDSLLFKSAEELYLIGDCERAIPSLGNYLNKFPQGYFSLEANYYRAECYYKAKDYTNAYTHYRRQ